MGSFIQHTVSYGSGKSSRLTSPCPPKTQTPSYIQNFTLRTGHGRNGQGGKVNLLPPPPRQTSHSCTQLAGLLFQSTLIIVLSVNISRAQEGARPLIPESTRHGPASCSPQAPPSAGSGPLSLHRASPRESWPRRTPRDPVGKAEEKAVCLGGEIGA